MKLVVNYEQVTRTALRAEQQSAHKIITFTLEFSRLNFIGLPKDRLVDLYCDSHIIPVRDCPG